MQRAFERRLLLFGSVVVLAFLGALILAPSLVQSIFKPDNFMPHATCYLNDARMIWLHVVSDFSIGAAYVGISAALAYLVYRARRDIPFEWMFLGFGLFIITCGMTHFMEVWTVWYPAYWLSGGVKLVTAAASVATALALPPLVPKIFQLIETAKASEERKRNLEKAHAELAAMNQRLRELDQLKSQFFSNVSHELRTPLALILGPVEKLIAKSSAAPDDIHDLEVIRRNGRILLKHVNDLLDASKLDAGKMGIRYSQFDMARLVRLMASNFDSLAEQRHIRYIVDAPDSLVVQADQEKIERILVNLLSNAFKFTPDNGVIHIQLTTLDSEAVCAVSDSGPGIPEESREVVFDRFRQLDGGTTRRQGGTGLGLSIVKDFVELHRGRVEISTGNDGGALIRFHIPKKAPADVALVESESSLQDDQIAGAIEEQFAARGESTSTPQDQKQAAGVPVERDGGTVVVVEDNREMNDQIAGLLGAKYRVAKALDGTEGLRIANRLNPDLILTDVMMPSMSGDQLLRAVRGDSRFDHVPVVLLTAKADDELRVRLLREGAQDYLMKPFSSEELLVRVDNLIQLKRAQEALRRRNEELQAFSYSVSHDLRAPLRAINGFVDIVLKESGANLQSETRVYLEKVRAAAQRMDRLIEDVLSYSRVATVQVQLRPVDLEALLREIIADRPKLQPPAATIHIQSPLQRVVGDPSSLQQCFSNLLTNAVKFVPSDRAPVVNIWSESLDGDVRIWIEDNGIGIDARDRDRLFRIFERLHSEREYEGTGIGLAIVRKAAERMEGEVGVESEPGKGSRFWIRLRGSDTIGG